MHPITLALYGVLFIRDPVPQAETQAQRFMANRSHAVLLAMVDEIDLELTQPTQRVRECLQNAASEEDCREYLRMFSAHIRRNLGVRA